MSRETPKYSETLVAGDLHAALSTLFLSEHLLANQPQSFPLDRGLAAFATESEFGTTMDCLASTLEVSDAVHRRASAKQSYSAEPDGDSWTEDALALALVLATRGMFRFENGLGKLQHDSTLNAATVARDEGLSRFISNLMGALFAFGDRRYAIAHFGQIVDSLGGWTSFGGRGVSPSRYALAVATPRLVEETEPRRGAEEAFQDFVRSCVGRWLSRL